LTQAKLRTSTLRVDRAHAARGPRRAPSGLGQEGHAETAMRRKTR
jgi:hypothetical protein